MRSGSNSCKGDSGLVGTSVKAILKPSAQRCCNGDGTGRNSAGGLGKVKCRCNGWSGSNQVSGRCRRNTGIIGSASNSDVMRSGSNSCKGDSGLVGTSVKAILKPSAQRCCDGD